MKNILNQYQGDAWSRRLSSDYNKFSLKLKCFFVFTHYLYKARFFLVCSCAAFSSYYMHKIVDSTWFTGGEGLLSDSPFWTEASLYMLSMLFFLGAPPVFKAILYNWYWLVRKNFKQESAEQC